MASLTKVKITNIDTSIVYVADPLVSLNYGSTLANTDIGFVFNRDGGISSNVALFWNETTDRLTVAYTTSAGSINSNISIAKYANIAADWYFGNLAGGTNGNTYVIGNILPTANGLYNFGSPTARWNIGYFAASTIDLGGSQISVDPVNGFKFSVGGTGTPTFLASNGLVSGSSLTTSGTLNVGTTAAVGSNLTVGGYINSLGNIIAAAGTFNNLVINLGNIIAQGGYFIGNGSQLTGIPAGYSNVQTAAYLNTQGYNLYSNVNVAAYLNTQGYNLYSNVNVAVYLTNNGYINTNSAYSNANVVSYLTTNNYTTQLYVDSANTSLKNYVDGQITAANAGVTAANIGIQGFINLGNVNLRNYVDGQITAANAGVVAANVGMKGYVDSQVSAANIAWQANAYQQQALIGNIQSSSYSNVNVNAYLTTNGYINTNSAYGNGNVASYLPTYTGNLSAGNLTVNGSITISGSDGNISGVNNLTASGYINTSGNILAKNIVGSLVTASQANITTVGNLTGLSVAGTTTVYGTAQFASAIRDNVGSLGSTGRFLMSSSTGALWTIPYGLGNFASNVLVDQLSVNVAVAGSNVIFVSQFGLTTQGWINATGNVMAGDATVFKANINSTQNSTEFNNGALVVAGGVGIAKDVYIQGNLYVANVIATASNVLTITSPLLYLVSNAYPYNYDIGFYGHFVGGVGNIYQHSGFVRNYLDGTWRLFSNVITEPSEGIVTFDSGILYDPIWTGGMDSYGNINLKNNSLLNINNPPGTYSNSPINASWNANGYVQINIQNINSVGNLVSADFIATAPDGNDGSKFIDLGINGNNWSSGSWTVSGANDGYLYINQGNLTIGTETPGKVPKIHVGGLLSQNITTTFDISTTYFTTQLNINSQNLSAAVVNGGTSGIGNIGAASGRFGTVFGSDLNVTGNVLSAGGTFNNIVVNSGNINAVGGYFIGNGAFLTGIVTGGGSSYSNVQVATYLPTYSGNIANIVLSPAGTLIANVPSQRIMISGANISITGDDGNLQYTHIPSGITWNKYDTSPSYTGYYRPDSIGLYRGDYSSLMDIAPENIKISSLGSTKFEANATTIYTVGNVRAGNMFLSASGSITFADGTVQTTAASYSNVQVATYLPTYTGTVGASLVNSTGNILGAGLSVFGNVRMGIAGAVSGQFHSFVGNVTQTSSGGAVYINTTGNIIAANITAANITTTGNVLFGNVVTGNIIAGNLLVGNIVSTANINAIGHLRVYSGQQAFGGSGNIQLISSSGTPWLNLGITPGPSNAIIEMQVATATSPALRFSASSAGGSNITLYSTGTVAGAYTYTNIIDSGSGADILLATRNLVISGSGASASVTVNINGSITANSLTASGNTSHGTVGAISGQFHSFVGNVTQVTSGGAVYFNTTGNLLVGGNVALFGNTRFGTAGIVSGAYHNFVGNINQYTSGGAVYFNTTGNLLVGGIAQISNIRLGASGNIQFADGTVQTTAATGAVSTIYANVGVILGNPTSSNLAVGTNAGSTNQGANAISIGFNAGSQNQGVQGIAIGATAGNAFQGTVAVAIGVGAGQINQASGATAIGYQAGQNGQRGLSVAIGYQTGQNDQQGTATAVGMWAGQNSQGNNTVAMGYNAAVYSQGDQGIALGYYAGWSSQGPSSIAIGESAGQTSQGTAAVAIGRLSGTDNQGPYTVAIGYQAGYQSQSANSVVIGTNAGYLNTPANTIVISGDGSNLSPASWGTFLNPIKPDTSPSNILYYNTTTKEVTYGAAAAGSYSNVQVATYLPTYTGTVSASLVNSTGNVLAAGLSVFGNARIGIAGAVSGQFHSVVGNITQTSSGGAVYINTTGNILANVGTFSSLNVNGSITASNQISITSLTGLGIGIGASAPSTGLSLQAGSGSILLGTSGAITNVQIGAGSTTSIGIGTSPPTGGIQIGSGASTSIGIGATAPGSGIQVGSGSGCIVVTGSTVTLGQAGASVAIGTSLPGGGGIAIGGSGTSIGIGIAPTVGGGIVIGGTSGVNVSVSGAGIINLNNGTQFLQVNSGNILVSGTLLTTTGSNILLAGNTSHGTVGVVSGAYHNFVGNINQYTSGGAVYINTTGNVMAQVGNFVDVNPLGNLVAGQSIGDTTAVWNNAYVGNVWAYGNIIPSSSNTYTLGSSTVWWSRVWSVAVNAQYADLAENYTSDCNYEPGTVVVFGGEKEVTVSTASHDPAVAGVVSTNPAYLMNAATEGISVALQGRVPTWVKGPVRKGDRLVSSKIKGIAERLYTPNYVPGCIIGKSLENIDTDEICLIEVVVGRV